MPRPGSKYRSVSIRGEAADDLDALVSDTGVTKTALLRKLVKLGRARIKELLLIDVPKDSGAKRAASSSGIHAA